MKLSRVVESAMKGRRIGCGGGEVGDGDLESWELVVGGRNAFH